MLSPLVHVEVDEAGHEVHAGGIELARRAARPPSGVDRHARDPDADDRGDAVPLDDDGDGPARLAALDVDEVPAADDGEDAQRGVRRAASVRAG